MVFLLSDDLIFPDPALADEDGLMAVGGDLSVERLMLAYQQGIFPWYSEGEPICWYSPHQRFVLEPKDIHISHSMKQLIRSHKYKVTFDTAFSEVIGQCAQIKRKGQGGTWITADMKQAYIALHHKGLAHSVEVWQDTDLVGGLYGVEVGDVFCGESMFSHAPNASKLALIWLCQNKNYSLIDCQLHTTHLERMGARYMERDIFLSFLKS
jgi:leucyl/phenylalanyl-tRNA--protein transferase